jgi:hypothetical protein
MIISQFDRASVRLLTETLAAELSVLAAKYGLSVKKAGGRFSATSFTPKFEFSVQGEGGVTLSPERVDFPRYCTLYGLQAEDLDKKFTANGMTYTVSGLKPNNSQFPILAKNAVGRTYKFPARVVAAKLHPEAKDL